MSNSRGSIPLTGQIRLGRDFNSQFYHGSNDTAQNNLASANMRSVTRYYETTNYNGTKTDIPYGASAQRSMSDYRGTTGRFPDASTSVKPTDFTDQNIAYVNESSSFYGNGFARPLYTNANWGTNVAASYASSSSDGDNWATNMVHYVGYLEPGTYQAYANMGIYNSGWTYVIVRGYSQPDMNGASTNYVYASRSRSSGSWENRTMGDGSFTVNATYPYVILDIECHNDNIYFLRNFACRKQTTSTASGIATTKYTNPYIKRIS